MFDQLTKSFMLGQELFQEVVMKQWEEVYGQPFFNSPITIIMHAFNLQLIYN